MPHADDRSDPIQALQHLAQLQEQIIHLRALIPSTILPLASAIAYTSPSTLYDDFAANAAEAVNSTRNFRLAWEDEETARALKQVRSSLSKNPDIVDHAVDAPRWWDATSFMVGAGNSGSAHADMDLVMRDTLESASVNGHPTTSLVEDNDDAEEDLSSITQSFRERNTKCTLEDTGTKQFKLTVPTGFTILNFSISLTENAPSSTYWRVSCQGGKSLHDSITRCLEMRPRRKSLRETLDMLGAYFDLPRASCEKCKMVLGPSALPPTARRRKNAEVGEWCALHEECL